ncbi:MAG TPA: class I SAM-dependent methyltransferase [Planctomycetota bacterium]|nr:class I SAM-dependent methyltransferase [Planctomycetota bacterium]
MRFRELAACALLGCALAACKASPSGVDSVAGNRDRHGPPDVAEYISRLESNDRIRDLDPERVLSKLALAPDAVVADIGCGPGVFSLRFARAVPRGVVYAVDVEPKQLDALRGQLLAGRFENVVPVLASYSTPHLPTNSCDLIFLADTYHHIDDRVEYMHRLQRVLRRGGRLALLEYKPGPLPVGPPPEHKLAEGAMERELTEAGWTLSERFDTHPNHSFEVWVPTQR